MTHDNTDRIIGGVIDALSDVTTATLTTLLLKKGLRSLGQQVQQNSVSLCVRTPDSCGRLSAFRRQLR